MKRVLPEVRIQDGYLLREHVSRHLHTLWAKENEIMANDSDIEAVIDRYWAAWSPVEQKVLLAICDMFDLTFYENTINVYIAPWFSAFSAPLVIGISLSGEDFVDVLTHELLHRLFTDNTKVAYGYDYEPELRKLFGNNLSETTLWHIPVHAGLKSIYLDIFNDPSRLEADIEDKNEDESYRVAWDYVQSNNYKKIIADIRHLYDTLAKTHPR